MKILYVEDQITRNISRISRLFDKYLTKSAKKTLQELEKDEYPPEPEEIRKIVETSNVIEMEYRFPQALQKVIQQHENYALFIIDRNLFEEEGYDVEEVKALDPSFTEEKYETYAEREGDYLFSHLVRAGTDVRSKFYFMTAYSAEEGIRGASDIQGFINLEIFSKDNFIEKGKEADFDRLKNRIDNIAVLNLQLENREYLNILRKNIDEKTADDFIKILSEKDAKGRIGDNLRLIRNTYQSILEKCVIIIPEMRDNCMNQHNQVGLGRETIDWLSRKTHINGIVRSLFFSVKEIPSKFSNHPNPEDATTDTVNSLTYALKDIILWFGKICSQYKTS
ncbi:MAG: hypothetical protein V2I97_01485 [Desulfococcaceae bacterium]|nr:hypothetical protein [Desulfococcaceae bacterium]